jgi:hypothetical protein
VILLLLPIVEVEALPGQHEEKNFAESEYIKRWLNLLELLAGKPAPEPAGPSAESEDLK